MPSPTPRIHPLRKLRLQLLALTVAVSLAHLALLQAAPLVLSSHDKPEVAAQTWSFATRTIAPERAPEPVPEPVPEPAQQPKPAPESPQPKVQEPPPVPVPTEITAPIATDPTESVVLETNPLPSPVEHAQAATENIATNNPNLDVEFRQSARVRRPRSELAQPAPEQLALAPMTPIGGASNSPSPAAQRATVAHQQFVPPPPALLKYKVHGEIKGFPYNVNGELQWDHDTVNYTARLEISHFLLGSRVQTSTGQLGTKGLKPTRFGDKVRSEVAAHFDYEANKVTFSANTPDVAMQAGVQDQLSVFMQMASMLGGAGPGGLTPGSTLSFQAIGPRSAENWVFNIGILEKLKLPGGEMAAIRLWRDATKEYDTKGEIWLAPDLGYLPVRIRLTQSNGDFVEQQWSSTRKP